MMKTQLTAPSGSAPNTYDLNLLPKEIYGDPASPVTVRLGNGGGGPTGIFQALADDYRQSSGRTVAVAWYQNISRLTLQALRRHKIDIALTYERDQENEAVAKQWARPPVAIYNSHFMITGPSSNPAGIEANDTPSQAFDKIARLAASQPEVPLFLSRNDLSATHCKERSLWQEFGHAPWEKPGRWYVCQSNFPADALRLADRESLYTLSDRTTFNMTRAQLKHTVCHVRDGETLRGSCNALLGVKVGQDAADFVAYMCSPRAQKLIGNFGEREYGESLFLPAQQADI